jgi:hypothetical protein
MRKLESLVAPVETLELAALEAIGQAPNLQHLKLACHWLGDINGNRTAVTRAEAARFPKVPHVELHVDKLERSWPYVELFTRWEVAGGWQQDKCQCFGCWYSSGSSHEDRY